MYQQNSHIGKINQNIQNRKPNRLAVNLKGWPVGLGSPVFLRFKFISLPRNSNSFGIALSFYHCSQHLSICRPISIFHLELSALIEINGVFRYVNLQRASYAENEQLVVTVHENQNNFLLFLNGKFAIVYVQVTSSASHTTGEIIVLKSNGQFSKLNSTARQHHL